MFRKEAIEYQSTRWEGKAVLLPGIPFAFIILLSTVFIASISIFITKGSYTRRVIVHGEVTTFPGSVNISASMQGTVVKSFVNEGDRVKKVTLSFSFIRVYRHNQAWLMKIKKRRSHYR